MPSPSAAAAAASKGGAAKSSKSGKSAKRPPSQSVPATAPSKTGKSQAKPGTSAKGNSSKFSKPTKQQKLQKRSKHGKNSDAFDDSEAEYSDEVDGFAGSDSDDMMYQGSAEGLPSDFEDEEIDEEEAFNTEDEETYGHLFALRQNSKGRKADSDDDDDSFDEDDENDPRLVDLSDLIPDMPAQPTAASGKSRATESKTSKKPLSKTPIKEESEAEDDKDSDTIKPVSLSEDDDDDDIFAASGNDEDDADNPAAKNKRLYLDMLKQLDEEEKAKSALRSELQKERKKTRVGKDDSTVAIEDQETAHDEENEFALGSFKPTLKKQSEGNMTTSSANAKQHKRRAEIAATLGDASGKLSLADILASLNAHDMTKGSVPKKPFVDASDSEEDEDGDEVEDSEAAEVEDDESEEDTERATRKSKTYPQADGEEEEEDVDTSIPEATPIALTKLSNQLVASRKSKVTKPLSAPLSEPQSERLQRKAATEVVHKEVSKWDAAVQAHRSAPHMSFPLNMQKKHNVSVSSLGATFGAANDLEEDLNALIHAYGLGMAAQAKKEQEALKSQALSEEEIRERTARLRRMKMLLSAQEMKNKRIAKIKSKTWHKIHKKLDEKHKLSLEELFEVDPEAAQREVERLEFERAKERALLTHSKAASKWAKMQLRRGANLDDNARNALQQQQKLARELMRKIRSADDGEEDDDEMMSEDDRNLDDQKFEYEDEEAKERAELAALRKEYGLDAPEADVSAPRTSYLTMEDDEVDAERKSKPQYGAKSLDPSEAKGIFGLAFMRRAVENERARNAQMLREVDELEQQIISGVEDEEARFTRLEDDQPEKASEGDSHSKSKTEGMVNKSAPGAAGKRAFIPNAAATAKDLEESIKNATAIGSIIYDKPGKTTAASANGREAKDPHRAKGILGGDNIFDVEGLDDQDSGDTSDEDTGLKTISATKLTSDRLTENAKVLSAPVSDQVAQRNAIAAKRMQTALRVLGVATGGLIEEDTAALLESREAMKQFSGSNDTNDFGREDDLDPSAGLYGKRSNSARAAEDDSDDEDSLDSSDESAVSRRSKKAKLAAVLASVDESEFQLTLDSDDEGATSTDPKVSGAKALNPWARDASTSVRDEQTAMRRATGDVAGGARKQFSYSGQATDATQAVTAAKLAAKGQFASSLSGGLTSEVIIDTGSSALTARPQVVASTAPGQADALEQRRKQKQAQDQKTNALDSLRAESDERWDGPSDVAGVTDVLFSQKQQEALVARAFGMTNHLEEIFQQEKTRLIEKDLPQEDPFAGGIPGWGSWGGVGVRKSKKQKLTERERAEKHRAEVQARRDAILKARSDSKLSNVIISDKPDVAALRYQVPMVPAPFQSRAHFEKYMQGAVGKEWNTQTGVYRATRPEVVTHAGQIIKPIKWGKQYALLSEQGISARKGAKSQGPRQQDKGGLEEGPQK